MEHVDLNQPKLGPPGAGLPLLQTLYLKFYVGPFVAKKCEWEQATNNFITTHQKIWTEVESLKAPLLKQKVLVPPLPGLEDSSRFWSINMTLEHILIMGEEIKKTVIALSQGSQPHEVAHVANFKPLGVEPPEKILKKFHDYINSTILEIEKKVKDKNCELKYEHPWFGGFTAKQWYWLLGAHAGIHYRQIKEIKESFKHHA